MATNRFRFHVLVLPIAIASLALAACGRESPKGPGQDSGNTAADGREAALKHVRCLREHGLDVPDPQFQPGGGMTLEMPGDPGDKLKLQRAEEDCRKHLDAVRPPELSPEDERKFRADALRHARCMREHGIDFPDPTFGEGGKVTMRDESGPGGVAPGNPRFDQAQEECAKFGGPKFGVDRAGGK